MLRGLKNLFATGLVLALIACSSVGDTPKAHPAAGKVTPAAPMQTARSGHTATLLPNGEVLITGGMNGNSTYLDQTELYSPAQVTFKPAPRLSTRRVSHSATLLPDGKVLIAGGYNGDYLASAELYDPATGRFTTTGSLTMPRSNHVAVRLNNGQVLLAGGVGTGWSFLASAELYDPATGTFRPTGSLTTPRESHTATLLKNGQVLITGGHKDRREALTVYSSAELYDPATGTFAATGEMSIVRHKHAAALLPDGTVLIVGGSDKRDHRGQYSSAELYEPAQGKFRAIGPMTTTRYKLIDAVVALKNGQVLIAGGAAHLELYDPATNTFKTVPGGLDTARSFSVATVLPDGRVLITGGYDQKIAASTGAWLYQS